MNLRHFYALFLCTTVLVSPAVGVRHTWLIPIGQWRVIVENRK